MPACLPQSPPQHGSPVPPLCLGRSSVFGEKVETVMMQKLNDKGQSVAAPPREVSRSAKSTWTGTRAASGQEGGMCLKRGCCKRQHLCREHEP